MIFGNYTYIYTMNKKTDEKEGEPKKRILKPWADEDLEGIKRDKPAKAADLAKIKTPSTDPYLNERGERI